MNPIEKLKMKLKEHPSLRYEEEPGCLTIHTPEKDGFSITLIQEPKELTVCFDGWHGHFDTEEEALDFIAFGLSDKCRVREFKRGAQPYKWVVEAREGNSWRRVQSTCLLFFRFWQRKEVAIFQNNVLTGTYEGDGERSF